MILILTEPSDPHANIVSKHLDEAAVAFLRVDPADFPGSLKISYRPTGPVTCLIKDAQRAADATVIRSVWNRRPGKPVADVQLHPTVREYIVGESEAFISSLKRATDAFWLNDPDANQQANRKPYQLRLAEQLGFIVPQAIITNDPDEAKLFVDSLNGDVALKAVSTPGITFKDDPAKAHSLMFYTKKVDRAKFLQLAQRVAVCPLIIQEYVPKAYELRITVVGQKIFPCAIYSQESDETREDWRHWGSTRARHEEVELPVEINQRCFQLMENLGISFGCIDMIVTPTGRYVFLEINPNGQWLWVQDETGMPISRAVADLLIQAEQ